MGFLRNAVLFSVAGHIAFFSLFSVSFGNRLPRADLSSVYFWGRCLQNSQIANLKAPAFRPAQLLPIASKPDTVALERNNQDKAALPYDLKPHICFSFNSEKQTYADKPLNFDFSPKRREPTIVLHPLLPYTFTLYFKDRQVAHVELMFNISGSPEKKAIDLKRKISSGNLEADLVTMRYISHYLFIQQASFSPDKWQSVKIDLSANND